MLYDGGNNEVTKKDKKPPTLCSHCKPLARIKDASNIKRKELACSTYELGQFTVKNWTTEKLE